MEFDLSNRRVRAVAPDDRVPHFYLVFADGRLLRATAGSTRAAVIAEAPNIRETAHGTGDGRLEGRELEIRLYVHGPWVCVTERFGTNAALIDTGTGSVRELSRADYHSDVSSYSAGFLERDGRTLLVVQTEWNRLDVLDAGTGTSLTEREVFRDDTEQRNYIDYFHSLLHVSPGSRHLLSNGWAWSPVDFVYVFSTEAFLAGYEPTGIPVSTAFGYNWDRPAAFLDDHTFVLALDEDEDDNDEPYRQLAFFDVPDLSSAEDQDRWLEPRALVDCDVFKRNSYGEVKGELHYDTASGCLVALTPGDGAHLISLDGDTLAHLPDVNLTRPPSHGDIGSTFSGTGGWSYAPRHRVFHRWADGTGIEERPLPEPGRR